MYKTSLGFAASLITWNNRCWVCMVEPPGTNHTAPRWTCEKIPFNVC